MWYAYLIILYTHYLYCCFIFLFVDDVSRAAASGATYRAFDSDETTEHATTWLAYELPRAFMGSATAPSPFVILNKYH